MRTSFKLFLSVLLPLVLVKTSFAALDLELTQGIDRAIPIAIVPFNGQDRADENSTIATVMKNDLQHSGVFRVLENTSSTPRWNPSAPVNYDYWRKQGADNIVVGDVTNVGGTYRIDFKLLSSVGTNHVVITKQFSVSGGDLRRLAHYLSDLVYQQLTGIRGVFSTKIAYILVNRNGTNAQYRLEVADADGFSPQSLLVSTQPILSPSWSPSGKDIAYVSFEKGESEVYLVNVATGRRTLVSNQPGINGAPAWSPDGRKLALVLSKSGSPNIYTYNVFNRQLTQITNDRSINTEPSWSPDGNSLLFTSDRGGTPQIYHYNLASQRTERVTYSGPYNARASYLAGSKQIVLLHRDNNVYAIAVQDLSSGRVNTLTRGGKSQSPSAAPNGRLVLFASQEGGSSVLSIVSLDNAVKLRLPARGGDVQEPAWSPFMS